jgi:hypothetical protein
MCGSFWPESCLREGGLSWVRPMVCDDQVWWWVLVDITSTYHQCYIGDAILSARLRADIIVGDADEVL